MKKYFSYALVGAIALSGAVGFSSCSSSSDEVVGNNPDYNPEQSSVKTQFTISFQNNVARANTRQSGATVQSAEDIDAFRGMDHIVLYPFGVAGTITSDHKKLGDAIDLKNIIVPTTATVTNEIPSKTLKDGSNSVLFSDVTIPVGTSSFLFYGKAKDDVTNNFLNGSLVMTGDEPGGSTPIKFDLVQTNSAANVGSVGEALAIYLTNIAKAGGFNSETKKSAWEATGNAGLKDLYDKFVSLKAGSSRTAQAAVQDLYSTIKDNSDDVSLAIKAAITAETYVSSVSTEGVLTFTSTIGNSEATYFPGDMNLPDGAALLNYDEDTNTFTQKVDGGTGNMGNRFTAGYDNYVYPASLYYYCNSGIITSASSKKSLYEDTEHNYDWETITGTANYEGGSSVKTSTRSVAILDPIQYAVGRLDMTINHLTTITEGEKKLMYDKNGDAYDAKNGFDVTGILIGGQKQVGFDFTPIGSAEKTIYDNITKSQSSTLTVTPSAASAVNYTLALETAADADVYVAVEFLNKGGDFEGADGVVPAGCKFYLVGKLSPKTEGTYDDTNTATGVANTGKRVFKQDYKTIASFSIAQGNSGDANSKGLGAAYNTIPDLRTPQLELGLSVNLEWQDGVQFEVEF